MKIRIRRLDDKPYGLIEISFDDTKVQLKLYDAIQLAYSIMRFKK